MSKVPVQKGKIIANPPTINQQTYSEHVKQAVGEAKLRKDGNTLTLHEPKTRRK